MPKKLVLRYLFLLFLTYGVNSQMYPGMFNFLSIILINFIQLKIQKFQKKLIGCKLQVYTVQ